MVFQEPKVEFISVDLTIDASSSSNDPGGVETCTGPLAPSNRCDYKNTYWLDGNGDVWYPDDE